MPDDTRKTLLTPAAHEKLRAEYEDLTTAGRRYIEERIAEARSHGDLRENADYDAAKNEQGLMEARIRQLRHILENAQLIEASGSDAVEVGSVELAAFEHLLAQLVEYCLDVLFIVD